MILTTPQVQQLMQTIEYFNTLFIARNVGTDVLSPYEKQVLRKHGIDVDTLIKSKIGDAYRFGILASALKNTKGFKSMSYDEFKRFLQAGGHVPLTKHQQYALNALKQQAYGDIKGLGNRIQQQTNQLVITVSQKQRAQMQKTIYQAAKTTMQARGTVTQFSSLLGHKTKDWARDFDRIADYIMHDAYQHGIAEALLEKHGDDVLVYYDVYAEACEHCVRTYLTGAIGSEPKVFKLKDILANGNNIGVKAKEYKPSVSPLHPWCRCTMNLKPVNTVWDAKKQQFILVRNNYGVKRKSQINITIN